MGKIQETFVEIEGVSVKISMLGKGVGEPFLDSDDLVIIIPGNPGITTFYDRFSERIHEKLNCSVWCVGHVGANPSKTPLKLPKFKENKDLYGLNAQVKSKVEFFEKYVPKNAEVHLIGHSVGAYMCLEMLDHPHIEKIVNKSYLLFPTIEYMAQTSNGKFLINFVKPIIWLTLFLSGVLVSLPTIVQNVLIHCYMYIADVPTFHCDNIKQLVRPSILKRIFFLAYEEMDLILQRNDCVIKNHTTKIKFFYSNRDGWTGNYYEKVRQVYPDADVIVTDINHSFVLKKSEEVADTFSNWVINKS